MTCSTGLFEDETSSWLDENYKKKSNKEAAFILGMLIGSLGSLSGTRMLINKLLFLLVLHF
jgi:hypothetical protein